MTGGSGVTGGFKPFVPKDGDLSDDITLTKGYFGKYFREPCSAPLKL